MTSSNLKKSSQLSHLSSPAAFQSKSSCSLSYRPPKTFPPFLPLVFQFGNGFPAHTRRQRGPVKYSVFPALKSELYPATTSKKVNFPRCSVFHRLPVVLPLSLPSSTISTSPYRHGASSPQFYSRFDVRLCTELSGTNVSVRA